MNCCIRQVILLRKCKWFQSLGHIGRNNYRLPSIQWEHGRGTHGALAAEIITEIPFPNKPYHLFQLILLREHKRESSVFGKIRTLTSSHKGGAFHCQSNTAVSAAPISLSSQEIKANHRCAVRTGLGDFLKARSRHRQDCDRQTCCC